MQRDYISYKGLIYYILSNNIKQFTIPDTIFVEIAFGIQSPHQIAIIS